MKHYDKQSTTKALELLTNQVLNYNKTLKQASEETFINIQLFYKWAQELLGEELYLKVKEQSLENAKHKKQKGSQKAAKKYKETGDFSKRDSDNIFIPIAKGFIKYILDNNITHYSQLNIDRQVQINNQKILLEINKIIDSPKLL